MKTLPAVGLVLVLASLVVSPAVGQQEAASKDDPDFFGIPTEKGQDKPDPAPPDDDQAEPKPPRETLQERRERREAARHAEKLAELQQPIRKVQAMIDAGELKPAFEGAREIRRRLGEPKHPQVEVLLAQLALIDDKPHLAVDFLKPFVAPQGEPLPKKPEASQFGIYYFHALGTMRHASQPDKQQRQALTQPGTQSFFGIPLDTETDTPSLTDDQQPKIRQALIVFDWLAGNAEGLQQVEAAQGAAQALTLLGDYKQAIQAYRFALNRARHGNLDQYFDSDGKNTLRAFIAELQRGLNEVRRLMDIKRYSAEYVLYRAADQQQRGRANHKRAIEIYDNLIDLAERNRQQAIDERLAQKLPALAEDQRLTPRQRLDRANKRVELKAQAEVDVPVSPFSEAARLNRFKCMLTLGQERRALKGLERFIAEDELGLYRGEALMIVSTMALDRFNFDQATKWLDKLDAWVVNARADNDDWSFDNVLPGMRVAAKQVTDAPRQETKMDFWGNVKKQPIANGQLVNRKTCPWYLDDLEERCAKYLGFMKLAEGDGEAALEQFKRIIALDPNASDGNLSTNPNDFTRLKFGCENGYLFAYPEDLDLYNRKQRLAILWADMAYVTRKWSDAMGRYQKLLDGDYGALSSKQRDYPTFAIGQCVLYAGTGSGLDRMIQAAGYFENVVVQTDHTTSEYRSVFALSKIARYLRDKKKQEWIFELIQQMAASKDKNRWVLRARLKVAITLMQQGEGAAARTMLESIDKSDGSSYHFAQFYLKEYSDQLQ